MFPLNVWAAKPLSAIKSSGNSQPLDKICQCLLAPRNRGYKNIHLVSYICNWWMFDFSTGPNDTAAPLWEEEWLLWKRSFLFLTVTSIVQSNAHNFVWRWYWWQQANIRQRNQRLGFCNHPGQSQSIRTVEILIKHLLQSKIFFPNILLTGLLQVRALSSSPYSYHCWVFMQFCKYMNNINMWLKGDLHE